MVAGARWAPFKMLQNITCITTFKVAILDKFYLSVVLTQDGIMSRDKVVEKEDVNGAEKR